MSQSAVSQKVIQLEERLGYKLFERRVRQLLLTEQGAKLYPVIHASLIEIRDSLSEIESQGQMSKLTVYCMPSFASSWLMPRLHDFHINHPNIDVYLVAELAEPNFHNEIIDIGICHGIGERCREGEELYRDMKAAGVLENMVMVFGQMNALPGARFRVGHAALTMAEYFRDDEHRDVLLLIDNIFRFIQAGMEVSGLMGQMPARMGYQPTLGIV